MTEKKIQHHLRYERRKRSVAIGKNIIKTLVEPITNADDSYKRLEKDVGYSKQHVYPITVVVDTKTRLVRVIDCAAGMTAEQMDEKFASYGADKSGASSGDRVRGLFGQGITDVLLYHSKGKIKSIKDGHAAICEFYTKQDGSYIDSKVIEQPVAKLIQEWGINSDHGTVVELILDKGTTIPRFDKLADQLSKSYVLRLINHDSARRVELVYIGTKTRRKAHITYKFPSGELIDRQSFTMQFEEFPSVGIEIELYKSGISLLTTGEDREAGLLVVDEYDVVYDQTFFGLENLPGSDRFYGRVRLEGARKIIIDKLNDSNLPEEILTDSRDGFNVHHDFYKLLRTTIENWLYKILSHAEGKRSDEGLSSAVRERYKKAFAELNKMYANLTEEEGGGTISTVARKLPADGIEFVRSSICVTQGKRYGLQLLINPQALGRDRTIYLSTLRERVGVKPSTITLSESDASSKDVIVKTIIIAAPNRETGDTVMARCGDLSATVVVSVVREEIFYPNDAIEFNPIETKALAGRDKRLKLYVNLDIISIGEIIAVTSKHEGIYVKTPSIIINAKHRLRSSASLACMDIIVNGEKIGTKGIVEACCDGHIAQATISITDRLDLPPVGSEGKFRGWDFDNTISDHLQATYNINPTSDTYGYILINPRHPLNKIYFGENPTKHIVEDSEMARLYLAEIILNESLNIAVSKAVGDGKLPAKYGPAMAVIQEIAVQKYRIGPRIYDLFVNVETNSEKIRKDKLSEIRIPEDASAVNVSTVEGLEALTPREQGIFRMYFGIPDGPQHTLEEIGWEFGITRERVRQILYKANIKLLRYNNLSRKLDKVPDGNLMSGNATIGEIKVHELGLSVRTTNALVKNGILSLQEILSTDLDVLGDMRGIGVTALDEISTRISQIQVEQGVK